MIYKSPYLLSHTHSHITHIQLASPQQRKAARIFPRRVSPGSIRQHTLWAPRVRLNLLRIHEPSWTLTGRHGLLRLSTENHWCHCCSCMMSSTREGVATRMGPLGWAQERKSTGREGQGRAIRAYRKRMRSLIHNRKLHVHLPALFNGVMLTELQPHEVTKPAQGW